MSASVILDLARIVAACVIWYYHATLTYLPPAHWGEYAVGFFIMASAYSIVRFSRNGVPPVSKTGRFLLARVGALLPLFVLINALIYACSFLWPSRLGRPFTFLEFALSTLGVSQYFGFRYLSTVMWFVPFIAQVYALLPALCALNRRMGSAGFLGLCFAVSLAADLAAIGLCSCDIREICRNWSPIFRLGEVAIGIAWADPQGISKTRASLVYLALALALTQVERLAPGAAYLWFLPLKSAAVALPILLAAVALWWMLRPWLQSVSPSLRLAGQASYPFFLAHGAPMQSVLRLCGESPTGWLAYLAACWLGAVALQWLMNCLRGRRT